MAAGVMDHVNPVPKLYKSIIEDVIESVRELFAEEGVEEQVLKDLKQIHRSKNKWKFFLKAGVMFFEGKDHVFAKAIGHAEW